jgi:hypothetical protein
MWMRRWHGMAMVAAMISASMPGMAAGEDVSALLLRKTQAFSDAGPLSDGQTMAAMADDRLIFFNKNGDRATKQDLASITAAPPNGVTTRMSVSDWDCQVHGDVAMTSFIDIRQSTASTSRERVTI